MDLIFNIFIFLLGLIVGSFLNCVIYRLEIGEGFAKGRSFCPHCKHKLGFLDLVPVLSFVWLGGRCRYCQKKISWQYPLVEMAAGLLFSAFFYYQLPFVNFIIAPFLIVIFVYDLKHYIIPDKIVFPAIAIALVYGFWKSDFLALTPGVFSSTPGVFGKSDFLISAFGAAGFFAAIVFGSRGKWMGIGDIKLGFLMGLTLGFPNILFALFLAFTIGAIMGVGMIILGKKTMKSEVPLGPFLIVGTFAALFWGEEAINWYLNLLS